VPNATTLRQSMLSHHTVTEDVGKVAAAAEVKTLVLSHFVPPTTTRSRTTCGPKDVRKHYKGEIVVAARLARNLKEEASSWSTN